MGQRSIKKAAEEYWDNVAGDDEVGVETRQMVIDAYICGAHCVTLMLQSVIRWHNDFFKDELE